MAKKENDTPTPVSKLLDFAGIDKNHPLVAKLIREHTIVYPQAAVVLAEIANIPSEQREAFCKKTMSLLQTAHGAIIGRSIIAETSSSDVFEEIEAAARALRHAIRRLSYHERNAFAAQLARAYHDLSAEGASPIGDLLPSFPFEADAVVKLIRLPVTTRVIRALSLAGSRLANKDPNRRDGAGGAQNWAFTGFVRELWRLAQITAESLLPTLSMAGVSEACSRRSKSCDPFLRSYLMPRASLPIFCPLRPLPMSSKPSAISTPAST